MRKTILFTYFLLAVIEGLAQKDSTVNKVDSFLLHQKGLLGTVSKNLVNKTTPSTTPVRNDLAFDQYKGKIIRHIIIKRLDFGTPLADTSKRLKNTLTHLGSSLHHKTREQVIRNNLFFKPGDSVLPYLMADNERHFRDLSFLQDVKITVIEVGSDSVDVVVLTKDVLSIGGSYRMYTSTKMGVTVSEANLAGTGHEFLLRGLFDNMRKPMFGGGAEYRARNLWGSFIDRTGGYISYNQNFITGAQDEEMAYTTLDRPLVNPYMRFTYHASAAWHFTHDNYATDTLYETNTRYGYYNYDAWAGWNTSAFKFATKANRDQRMRTLISMRFLQQSFSRVPLKYTGIYAYQYPDLRAVLSSVTVFKQEPYKAQYVYGFGINEDIPAGADLSLITGWTNRSGVERPYVGIDLERYFFTKRESYFNYILKGDAYLHHGRAEDVNLLFNLNYFSRLLRLGQKWKQRTFVTIGAARQINRYLNPPLFLQSDFGVREWSADSLIAGDSRVTLKAEAVFYTPWNVAYFRFAPFVFTNICRFTPLDPHFPHSNWYNSIGGGVRVRNESLIFQTAEFRAFYFPQTNFRGERWRLEFNTNLRFRFNQQFEKKPDFVNVNVM